MAKSTKPSAYSPDYHVNLSNDYSMKIKDSGVETYRNKLMVGTPTTGVIRMEWAVARFGQVVPANFSKAEMISYQNGVVPLRYSVADAQNMIVQEAINTQTEWLIFIEHDTMPPPDAFIRFNEYIRSGEYPVVSGLYFTRSVPAEPLVYRGLGNSYYTKWKLGDKVMVSGVPTGMLLINMRLLKLMYNDAPEYSIKDGPRVHRVFDTPEKTWFDEVSGTHQAHVGTSDLDWCDKVIAGDYMTKAGWPELGKKKYPFLVDTNIACGHIDIDGTIFPIQGIRQWCMENGNI